MITYRWAERHTTTSGVTYTRHVTMSERISDAFQTYYHWPSQLAANLAMASLLGRSADEAREEGYDTGYQNGVDSGSWTCCS